MQVALLLLKTLLVASLAGVLAQNAPGELQVDPNAQCGQGVRDQITACLDQVETDESQLSGGPCTSSDWDCICTKQQGMVDCYSPCPGLQPVDMLRFNDGSCKGQNGVTITSEGGDLTYTWSTLPSTSNATSSPDVATTASPAPEAVNTTAVNTTAINPSNTPTVNPSNNATNTPALNPTHNSTLLPTTAKTNLSSPDSAMPFAVLQPILALASTGATAALALLAL